MVKMDLKFEKGVSLQKALEMLDAVETLDVDAIYIHIGTEPPELNVLTDEESGDEEYNDFNRLSEKILRAPVELVLRNSERDSEIYDDITEAQLSRSSTKAKKLVKEKLKLIL
ncbi:uncharacterized protein LOC126892948 [Diabrotica virgifera virgifera]|uniref:Uncharacterized protein n=1 Tax=Diabrotica virgifera virgifera TaxID=50390 RepID=A0ABM5L8T3_DIAVI|nr:uncharacterized protein LOC126892948 [Diabrotica virgifera virgifera]